MSAQYTTTSREDIRRVLGNSPEPMRGRDICDALGAASEKERASIYAQLHSMAKDKLGVESIEHGMYQLVPGWSKKTGQVNRETRLGKPAPKRVAAEPAQDKPPVEIPPVLGTTITATPELKAALEADGNTGAALSLAAPRVRFGTAMVSRVLLQTVLDACLHKFEEFDQVTRKAMTQLAEEARA
jgi:predicted Zn-ribbon and HTH transcriptional regulator